MAASNLTASVNVTFQLDDDARAVMLALGWNPPDAETPRDRLIALGWTPPCGPMPDPTAELRHLQAVLHRVRDARDWIEGRRAQLAEAGSMNVKVAYELARDRLDEALQSSPEENQ